MLCSTGHLDALFQEQKSTVCIVIRIFKIAYFEIYAFSVLMLCHSFFYETKIPVQQMLHREIQYQSENSGSTYLASLPL